MAARLIGLSVPTVRAVYLSLRELLLDPLYDEWNFFDPQPELDLGYDDYVLPWGLLWSLYAQCYENQECQRNFLYGRRKKRECARCPILTKRILCKLTSEQYRARWLRLVDQTREFYLDTLGIRREVQPSEECFPRRANHECVISTARYYSKTGEGMVDLLKPGPGTVIHLWETLLQDIAQRGDLASFPIVSWKGQN